jgi:hypothetical protein
VLSEQTSGNADFLFGGLPVVLGGDFRQILPVIPGASRPEVVDAALCSSPLWPHVKVLALKENMRLQSAGLSDGERASLDEFAKWVVAVGDGSVPTEKRAGESESIWIRLPSRFLIQAEGDKVAAIVQETLEIVTEALHIWPTGPLCVRRI